MAYPVIETPRGKIVVTANGRAELIWNPNFKPKWQEKYSAAQKFVDSEILRLCAPMVPLRTGMLIKSGILGTVVGSGTVSYIAPYARAQYYRPRKTPSLDPLRGPFWFERMKAIHGREILEGARRIAGRGT